MMLSAEDIAWADSCLTKDSDSLENGWNSLKDALLETIDTQHDSSAYANDNSRILTEMEIVFPTNPDSNETLNSNTSARIVADGEGSEQSSDDNSNHENSDDFWSRHSIEDVFLPTYNESVKDVGACDPEMEFVFQELEQSTDDIFKIWDLDIVPAEEEDDLIEQLNKALAGKSPEPTAPVPDDSSKVWEGLKDVSVDDLISGIADLSLSPNSG